MGRSFGRISSSLGRTELSSMGSCASADKKAASGARQEVGTNEIPSAQEQSPSHAEQHVKFVDKDGDINMFLQMKSGKFGMFIWKKASVEAGRTKEDQEDESFEVDEITWIGAERKMTMKMKVAGSTTLGDTGLTLPSDVDINWVKDVASKTDVVWKGDEAKGADDRDASTSHIDNKPLGDPLDPQAHSNGEHAPSRAEGSRCC